MRSLEEIVVNVDLNIYRSSSVRRIFVAGYADRDRPDVLVNTAANTD